VFETIAEITINRPIEEVFAYIADNENDPQWCVPVVETTRITTQAEETAGRWHGLRCARFDAYGVDRLRLWLMPTVSPHLSEGGNVAARD
jgi:uncharacterized protein YndB with AHSA1/START domain